MVEAPLTMSLLHPGEGLQRILLEGSGQGAPLIERYGRRGP